jgi:hypothetical protein
MKSFAVLALASGFTLVTAQTYPPPDISSINNDTKQTWCVQQEASCDSLCQDEFQGDPTINTCDDNDLQFSCVCPGGLSPNTSQYSLWIPFQLCTLSIQQCSDNCNNDAKCSQLCFNGKKCGASDPTRVNVTTTASTATATGSKNSYPTGTNTATASPTNNPFNSFAPSLTDVTSFHAFGAIIVGMAIGLFEIL